MPSDHPAAFAGLRQILQKHADGMIVLTDTQVDFTVATRATAPNGKPMWFAAVLLKKSAVTYHLMPLYFNPALQAAVPAELLRRKQGKTCFNFQRPDPALFQQLDRLTRQARQHWHRCGLLQDGAVSPAQLEAALRAGGEDPEALTRLRQSKGKQATGKRKATTQKKAKRGRG